MNSYKKHKAIYLNQQSDAVEDINLIGEEPLSIRVQGKPYVVIMRTPGDEIPHAAGFCLAEGIVDDPDDISAIGYCDENDTNVVTVTLKHPDDNRIVELLDRKSFVSQTSCGICGKTLIEDISRFFQPISDQARVSVDKALSCMEALSEYQTLRKKTHASHAAALYDKDYRLLTVSEDAGRHNALDKTIGKLFLKKKLHESAFLILVSRISYELVQKAARAKIPVIFSISRPTSLAVALAAELNMTVACLAKESGIYVFTGRERLV